MGRERGRGASAVGAVTAWAPGQWRGASCLPPLSAGGSGLQPGGGGALSGSLGLVLLVCHPGNSSGRLTGVFTKQPYPGRKTGWDTDHICYSGHSATSSFSGSLSPSGRSPNSGAVWTTDPPPVVSARLGQRFLSKGRGRHLQLCWPREVSALLLSHESSHRRSANG